MNAIKILNHRHNKLETIFEQNKIKQNQITAKWTKPERSFFVTTRPVLFPVRQPALFEQQ